MNFCFAYDAVVSALGWHFDVSMFGEREDEDVDGDADSDVDVDPTTTLGSGDDYGYVASVPDRNGAGDGPGIKRRGKYPSMTSHYESTNVPGLFFAGAAAHALDYRKAAGGFIHGFRYTAQALVRDLLRRYHGQPWRGMRTLVSGGSPARGAAAGEGGASGGEGGIGFVSGDAGAAVREVMTRMNRASSLYQMYGVFADVVFASDGGAVSRRTTKKDKTKAKRSKSGGDAGSYVYAEDVPLPMILKGSGGFGGGGVLDPHDPDEFIALSFEWGEHFKGPQTLHHNTLKAAKAPGESLFLHPVLRAYRRTLQSPAKDAEGEKGENDTRKKSPTPSSSSSTSSSSSALRYHVFAEVHLAEDLATDFTHPKEHFDKVRAFFDDPEGLSRVWKEKDEKFRREASLSGDGEGKYSYGGEFSAGGGMQRRQKKTRHDAEYRSLEL